MNVRECWLGIRDGAADDAIRATVFRAPNGESGPLSACHVTGADSAHPRTWMFRLGDNLRWHWEHTLTLA